MSTVLDPRPPKLEAPDFAARARWLAPLTIVLASLVTIVPAVATYPVLPPFGLMAFIAWRIRRPDVFRSWAPVPLGVFDDLVSGQPMGCAMLLWTIVSLSMDVIDTRLFYRDFWQDWLVAAGGIAFVLVLGRLLAVPLGAAVDLPLLVQVAASILCYPLVVRLVAALDPRPLAR